MHRIERWGLEAVTGRRVWLFTDYIRLMCAEMIELAFRARANSDNWAAWAKDNRRAAALLIEAEALSEE